MFGSKEELRELMDLCHKNGIKVILTEFLITPETSFCIQRCCGKGEKSKYANGIYKFFSRSGISKTQL